LEILTIVTVNKNSGKAFIKTELNVVKCLKSINNINWLIIDSMSNDLSSERIKNIKKNYSNLPINILREKDNGIYNAMNKAILKVESKFIIFINSGDTLNDTVLKKIELEKIDKFCSVIFSYKNTTLSKFPFNFLKTILHNFECFLKLSLPSSHNAIIYSSFILKRYLFNENYICASDYDQYQKMIKNKSKFIYKKNLKISTISSNGFISKRKFASYIEYIKINKNNNFVFNYFYWLLKLKLLKLINIV
tara:strand:- start:109 stop:855 length:747 start_codon:yes stop_codon:yes gene_type:complete